MNNRGFTLVELLATLIALALVTSIGTYSIISIMNSAKEEDYNLLITEIKSSSELYYQECKYGEINPSNITCENCEDNDGYCPTLGSLVTYGYLKGNNKNGDIYTITNPKDNKDIRNCEIKITFTNNKIKVDVYNNHGNSSCPTY